MTRFAFTIVLLILYGSLLHSQRVSIRVSQSSVLSRTLFDDSADAANEFNDGDGLRYRFSDPKQPLLYANIRYELMVKLADRHKLSLSAMITQKGQRSKVRYNIGRGMDECSNYYLEYIIAPKFV